MAETVEPLGVIVKAECDLKLEGCTALAPAPVTVVKVGSAHDQFVVCRSCLERMVREGEWRVPGARVAPRIDFLFVNPAGQPVIAVEVKTAPRLRALDLTQWATSLKRNLGAHGAAPIVPYFLILVVPESGFLWSNPEAPFDAMPDYVLDLTELSTAEDPVPEGEGGEAENWSFRALTRLLEGQVRPQGLWWTESGLQRLLANDRLRLVQQAEIPVHRAG
jgi:hypothetical protein